VGTALGPHGVAIMDFCKEYNAATEAQRGTIVPVEITIFEDRSFTFVTKTPPTPVLMREAAGLDKGEPDPGRKQVAGTITDAQVDRDRPDQAARPQRQRSRGGQAAGRRHRPQSMGIDRRGLSAPTAPRSLLRAPTPAPPDRPRPGGPRPPDGPTTREPTWRKARSTPTRRALRP
jgi:hypothetical protein